MAQPLAFRLQYLGAIEAKANQPYTATQIKATFPNANAFMLKTLSNRIDPVSVSINATPGFPLDFNEATYFDGTTSLKYVFDRDCTIVALQEVSITP